MDLIFIGLVEFSFYCYNVTMLVNCTAWILCIAELYRNNLPLLHSIYSTRPETFSQKRKPICSPGSYQLYEMTRGLHWPAMVRFQRYGMIPGRVSRAVPVRSGLLKRYSPALFFWEFFAGFSLLIQNTFPCFFTSFLCMNAVAHGGIKIWCLYTHSYRWRYDFLRSHLFALCCYSILTADIISRRLSRLVAKSCNLCVNLYIQFGTTLPCSRPMPMLNLIRTRTRSLYHTHRCSKIKIETITTNRLHTKYRTETDLPSSPFTPRYAKPYLASAGRWWE